MHTYPLDASLTLAEAAPKWLEEHGRLIMPNTIRNYKAAIAHLNVFMGTAPLQEIQINHLREYQQARKQNAGCHTINAELSVLQMILRESGQWPRIVEFYKPIRVPARGAGHTLTQEEEQRLREVAFSQPKWRLAAHCMTVMLATTMGFGELRQLRRKDVDMKRKSISIREGAKNRFRERTIPLNETASESMKWILARWQKLGGHSDEHYILPHRPRVPQGPWLLDEPMGAITTAFDRIRKASGLAHFRLYDCRVQAITKLLSNPMVSPQTSKEIAGHISQAMQNRYSIQLFDTKKAALDALEDPSARPPESVPLPPAFSSAPMDFTHATIQAEIARQVALALEAHLNGTAKATAPKRPRKNRERDKNEAVFHRRPSAKNVIAFPSCSA